HGAKHRQQQTFGGKLAQHSRTLCAERGTNCYLATPRSTSGKQRARDVRACNEENERSCAEQQQQRTPHGPDEIVIQRLDAEAVGIHPCAIRTRETRADEIEVALRPRDCHAIPKSCDDLKVVSRSRWPKVQ